MGALLALPDVLALKEHPAGGGLEQSVEVLDQGGLARPGVADDAQVLPPVGREIHINQRAVLKRGAGGIDVAEFFRLDNRFHTSHFLI